jgi:hypothetical protein
MPIGEQEPTDSEEAGTPPPSASPGEVLAEGTSETTSAAEAAKGEGAAGEVKDPWWKFW